MEAGARSWRNVQLGLMAIPLLATGAVGLVVVLGVAIAGQLRGPELVVLGSIFLTTTLAGLATTIRAIAQYRRHPGCIGLRDGQRIVALEFSWMQTLSGYKRLATYTLSSGARGSCFVPDNFYQEPS